MLGWRYSPENALCCAFGAIRLVSVRKSNDCLVVAFDYRCNNPYSTIQLWIGDIDTVQYVNLHGLADRRSVSVLSAVVCLWYTAGRRKEQADKQVLFVLEKKLQTIISLI